MVCLLNRVARTSKPKDGRKFTNSSTFDETSSQVSLIQNGNGWKAIGLTFTTWMGYRAFVAIQGTMNGFDDEKWKELGAKRAGKQPKYSRFRNKVYVHSDIMSDIVRDSMVTGENITPCDQQELIDNENAAIESSAAQKRAKKINGAMKSRKKRKVDADLNAKEEAAALAVKIWDFLLAFGLKKCLLLRYLARLHHLCHPVSNHLMTTKMTKSVFMI